MRRVISMLFLSLMLLQAIPVLHFFSSQKEVFYVYIDEEKTEENAKEKKESKEYLSLTSSFSLPEINKPHFPPGTDKHYTFPLLEFLTPPPDRC